jgi:serine/threonine-protein kinase ATR
MHLDEDRPTKRRKTLHESSEDANISAYHQLTLLLNGSSEDSPIHTLASLHQVVEYVLSLFLIKL